MKHPYNHKEQINKICLSNPVLMRARCKYCGGFPEEYSYSRFGWNTYDYRDFLNWFIYVQHNTSRLCKDFYLEGNPSDFHSASFFSYSPRFKSYNSVLHYKRGVAINWFEESLSCKCGRTLWVFNQKSHKYQKEVVNRKSEKTYPKKFR